MPSRVVRFEDRAVIITAQGLVYTIDLEDVPKVEGRSWYARPDGYLVARSADRSSKDRLHRVLLNAPAGVTVDHIDGNLQNNRKCNLRLCTQAENVRNQKLRTDNTSGFKGVYLDKQRMRWCAQIQIGKKLKNLGRFSTPEQASAAYQDAAVRLFGEFKRATEHE